MSEFPARDDNDWRPLARPGMRIGLLGGSFDPPHAGHLHISLEALKRLRLDRVWWLVSPGNPLKQDGPWPLAVRLQQCLALTKDHPRVEVTALEASLGSPYTAETLGYLRRRYPATRFVWLMGGDNLAGVHRWRRWQRIFGLAPIAVIDRPGSRYRALAGRAAHMFRGARGKGRGYRELAGRRPPAWCFVSIPLSDLSSTAIRARNLRLRADETA